MSEDKLPPPSQPGEPEIQKMAEDYADTCFAHGSFRWGHVVKMYLKGISDYRLWLLQKSQMESETKETPSREPYTDNLKIPIGSQPGNPLMTENNDGSFSLTKAATDVLDYTQKRLMKTESSRETQPLQPVQGKEELIKFANWIYATDYSDLGLMDGEKLVEVYLKVKDK